LKDVYFAILTFIVFFVDLFGYDNLNTVSLRWLWYRIKGWRFVTDDELWVVLVNELTRC